MEPVRLATEAEIKAIVKESDLTPASSVVAWGPEGNADLAVLRQVSEIDPIYFREGCEDRRKLMFIWAIENAFRILGTPDSYYFNVHVEDEKWNKVLENFGAIRTSTAPEYRYKKSLR